MFQWTINPVIYQNSTIIASSAVVFSFLAGFITTTKLRKQIIMRKILHCYIFILQKVKTAVFLYTKQYFNQENIYQLTHINSTNAINNRNVLYFTRTLSQWKNISFLPFLNANVCCIIFYVFLLCGVEVVKRCLRDTIIRTPARK